LPCQLGKLFLFKTETRFRTVVEVSHAYFPHITKQ
jgi:hypothetical protein